MRTIIFIISLFITSALVFTLNRSIPSSGESIPPLGKFLNPFTGFWQNKTDDKLISETLSMTNLKEAVKIVYDDRLVPHIFAENELDLHYAQGYTTAKHRLFQMDLVTRLASGRLSEILGSELLEFDKLNRRRGIAWAAQNAVIAWRQSDQYPKLEAYVKGVNDYINSLSPKDYPLELKLLGYEPEQWTDYKTALFIKNMADVLASREEDIEATNALDVLGQDAFDFIYPEYNPKTSPVIPADKKWTFKNSKESPDQPTDKNLSSHPKRITPKMPKGIGSNNWAVSGKKTASGYPILCNDPHLNLTLPSTWFEVQLHCPEFNVYGVSLPGIPGVIIGFNNDISWGVTNVGHDVADYYRINWAEANKESYFLDGKIKPADIVIEKIKVKDQETVLDTVKYTVWGPVVFESSDQQDLALRWLGHTSSTPNELSTFNQLAKAKNYDDYYKALQHYTCPAQNMVFASREGDIAMRVQGRFPIKKKEQGRFVQDGDQTANAWSGYIPYEQIPAIKNPTRAFVSSANQHSTAPDYPYYYNGEFEQFRGRILNRILGKMDKISPDDMKALQNSSFSIKAEEALPLLLDLINTDDLDETDQLFYEQLKEWDFKYKAESVAPILFEKWFKLFYAATWDEVFQNKKAEGLDMLGPEEWRTIALLKEQPDHKYFDLIATNKKETAKWLANMTFKEMSNEIQIMDNENEKLEWYQYRDAAIKHLLRIPDFSRTDLKVDGCGDALNAVRGNGGSGSLNGYGPSWRMIVAFKKDGIDAHGIYPGGQSGDPSSFYYDNMIDDWAAGNYYKLNFLQSADELDQDALFIQNLEPTK